MFPGETKLWRLWKKHLRQTRTTRAIIRYAIRKGWLRVPPTSGEVVKLKHIAQFAILCKLANSSTSAPLGSKLPGKPRRY